VENRRFDSLARSLASGASRRSVLKGLLGLGGAAVAGGVLRDEAADAARRPTPTPKPVTCPGRQTWNGSQCVCPGDAPYKCGSDCCTGEADDPSSPTHSECCDNACCFGTCYGEELCCPTNWRSGEQPPTHQVCTSANGVECCPYDDRCCEVDGCCDTVCWGGQDGISNCCPPEAYCPGDDSPDICCTNDFICCGTGTSGNICRDPNIANGCCTDSDCTSGETCQLNVCVSAGECPPGSAPTDDGCERCPGGFASADGLTCERCGPGTYAPSGSPACLPCAPGYYTDDSENDACNPCPPGWHAPEAGSGECTECPLGTFSDSSASSACEPCAAGTFTEHIRSTECIACTCQGTCDATNGQCAVPVCDPGNAPNGSGFCAPCGLGSYSADGTVCVPCGLGTYQDLVGQSACAPCPAGSFAGLVGQSSCSACACGAICSSTTGQCPVVDGGGGECGMDDSDCTSGK
jgi:hypothetical protein